MSRTEDLLEALAQALEARQRVEAVKLRYARMDAAAMGEPPLDAALAPVLEYYAKKIDAFRAHLVVAFTSLR